MQNSGHRGREAELGPLERKPVKPRFLKIVGIEHTLVGAGFFLFLFSQILIAFSKPLDFRLVLREASFVLNILVDKLCNLRVLLAEFCLKGGQ